MSNLNKSKSKLVSLLQGLVIKKLDKETLLDLTHLNEVLKNINLTDEVAQGLADMQENDLRAVDVQFRVDSLLTKLTEKKYIKKVETRDYILYEYQSQYDLYFYKKITYSDLINYLNDITFEYAEVYFKNNSKFELLTLVAAGAFKLNHVNKRSEDFVDSLKSFKLDEYEHSRLKIRLYKFDKSLTSSKNNINIK